MGACPCLGKSDLLPLIQRVPFPPPARDTAYVSLKCANVKHIMEGSETHSITMQRLAFSVREAVHHDLPEEFSAAAFLAASALTVAPLARCHTSPPHRMILSAAAVGVSNAGRMSR